MSVYEQKFHELSRYNPDLVKLKELKEEKFYLGLNAKIRDSLATL